MAAGTAIGEPEVVSGCEAIDHHPNFCPCGPARRLRRAVGVGGLSGEPIVLGSVIEARANPPKASGSNQPVESLIDRSARSKVGKILRSPDARLRRGRRCGHGWRMEC